MQENKEVFRRKSNKRREWDRNTCIIKTGGEKIIDFMQIFIVFVKIFGDML